MVNLGGKQLISTCLSFSLRIITCYALLLEKAASDKMQGIQFPKWKNVQC